MLDRESQAASNHEMFVKLGFKEPAPGILINGPFAFRVNLATSALEPLEDLASHKLEIISIGARPGDPDYLEFVGPDAINPSSIQRTTRAGWTSNSNFSGGPHIHPDQYSHAPIVAQLAEAGFSRDDGAEVYRRTVRRSEVIAVVSHSEFSDQRVISRLLTPKRIYPFHHHAALKFGLTIVGMGVREVKDLGSIKTIPVVKAGNDAMDFDIDAQGRIYVESAKRVLSAEEIGIERIEEVQEGSFRIGGVNKGEAIKSLLTLNKRSVGHLENLMQPGRASDSGYLARGQSLVGVLAQDNDYVIGKGFTHQQLGAALRYAQAMYHTFGLHDYVYSGVPFHTKVLSWRGSVESPFRDESSASEDLVLINRANGREIKCSFLLAEMISRYGFYEGPGTRYRLEPVDLIEVLGLTR